MKYIPDLRTRLRQYYPEVVIAVTAACILSLLFGSGTIFQRLLAGLLVGIVLSPILYILLRFYEDREVAKREDERVEYQRQERIIKRLRVVGESIGVDKELLDNYFEDDIEDLSILLENKVKDKKKK